MRITQRQAVQVHPVPSMAMSPKGPFPQEILQEPELITDSYDTSEYGGDMPLGATVQNDYNPPRYLRCSLCFVKVLETETQDHVCEE